MINPSISPFLTPFLASLVLIFFAELVGVTELVIFSQAMRHKAMLAVFSGAFIAHAGMDGLAIIAGNYLARFIPSKLIMFIAGTIFILLGIRELMAEWKRKRKIPKPSKGAFFETLGLVALAEAGDRTLIASGLLAAEYKVMLPVFLGAVLALATAIGLNVTIATFLGKKLSPQKVCCASGALFILFGIISIVQAF